MVGRWCPVRKECPYQVLQVDFRGNPKASTQYRVPITGTLPSASPLYICKKKIKKITNIYYIHEFNSTKMPHSSIKKVNDPFTES
jgi:hypothetical protein